MSDAQRRRAVWDAHRTFIEELIVNVQGTEFCLRLQEFRYLMFEIERQPKLAKALAPSMRDLARYRDDIDRFNRDILARIARAREVAPGADKAEVRRAWDGPPTAERALRRGTAADRLDEARALRRARARLKKLGRPRGIIVKVGGGPA